MQFVRYVAWVCVPCFLCTCNVCACKQCGIAGVGTPPYELEAREQGTWTPVPRGHMHAQSHTRIRTLMHTHEHTCMHTLTERMQPSLLMLTSSHAQTHAHIQAY